MVCLVTSGYELQTTPSFDKKAEEYAGSMERWDEIARSYDYLLRQNPRVGERIFDTPLWALTINRERQPTIYYHIDDESGVVLIYDLTMFDG